MSWDKKKQKVCNWYKFNTFSDEKFKVLHLFIRLYEYVIYADVM